MTDSEATPEGTRVLRMGTFFWRLPSGQLRNSVTVADYVRGVKKRLREDPRVLSVHANEDIEPDHWFQAFYPTEVEGFDAMLFGSDALSALVVRPFITFEMQVPRKNQPLHHGYTDVPSDKYWAAWDGVTLLVMWSQQNERIPFSGGHIVVDVLRDAVQGQAGADLVNQACSPGCDFMFIHPGMILQRLSAEDEANDRCLRVSPTPRASKRHYYVATTQSENEAEMLDLIGLSLMPVAEYFARVKSLGRRLISIEDAAREQLSDAILHQYMSLQISELPRRARLRAYWSNRQSRKAVRQTVTALLLCLANMEALLRTWHEAKRDFNDSAEDDLQLLFETDFKDDAAQIQSLELDHLEAAVERLYDSLNNSDMITATIRGAMAGGVAGGVLGLAANFLGS